MCMCVCAYMYVTPQNELESPRKRVRDYCPSRKKVIELVTVKPGLETIFLLRTVGQSTAMLLSTSGSEQYSGYHWDSR